MILGGPGCRLQTCRCREAQWFDSTFWAEIIFESFLFTLKCPRNIIYGGDILQTVEHVTNLPMSARLYFKVQMAIILSFFKPCQPSQGVTPKKRTAHFFKKEYIYHYFGHLIVHIHEKISNMRDVYPTVPIVLVRNKMFRKQLFRIFALPYLLIQYLWSHRFALCNAKTSSQQKIVHFAYFSVL